SIWKPGSGAGAQRRVPLITLDRITRNPQLRIERRRNYRPLVLGEGENLSDPTFYALFDRNGLGVVRTRAQAPAPATLPDYITLLEFVKPSIAVTPLVDGNAVRAVQDVGTLTRLTLAVGPDVSPQAFNRSRMIFDVIQSMRRDLGEVAIEITVKISPKGQH